MNIEPLEIEKTTLVQMIIEKIKNLIMNGELKPGDKLPSEPALAQLLGTSRTPVREAVKVLEALNVLEVKRGDGTYLCDDPETTAVNPLIFNLFLKKSSPHELWEFRVSFEVLHIELAVEKRSKDDLAKLKKILEQEQKLVEAKNHDSEKHTQTDLDFHHSILEATDNNLVKEIGKLILEVYKPFIKAVHEDPELSAYTHKLHTRIYECIEKKDLSNVKKMVTEIHAEWTPFWRSIYLDRSNSVGLKKSRYDSGG